MEDSSMPQSNTASKMKSTVKNVKTVKTVETVKTDAAPRRESPLQRTQKRHSIAVRTRTSSTRSTMSKRRDSDDSLRALSSVEERVLKVILSEPMDYIDHPEFHTPGAETRIYGPVEIARPDVTWYRPLMDDFIAARHRTPRSPKSQGSILLTGAQECILFMKYNFARFSISEVQKTAGSRPVSLKEAHEILRWNAIAEQYREQLAETNLALVLAMAKRVRLPEVDFADLISEGNMALMRSVDKFDCGRGFKFSTYACRAILKAFSRHGIKVTAHRKRFGAEFDPILEKSNFPATKRATHERDCADEVRHIVLSNKAELSELEIMVIGHRYGMREALGMTNTEGVAAAAAMARVFTVTQEIPAPALAPLTLEQVGQVIGVTKERVRQIQNKALDKIRLALQSANPSAMDPFAADSGATQSGAQRQRDLPRHN
ncbi:MAG: sigma-70 family RNA polymerase sigma factor [Planctomycetota bacterium]|nr:MAG: sigma-70 family RNA polymerase sigma factor [Planctomycetota bacterium]